MKTSPLSLMPEDLEKQLKPDELSDLFALLTLDKPPTDPTAKRLPGAQPIEPRETSDPAQFAELVGQVAPGFNTRKAGKPGVAIMAEHAGRVGVLRTHPASSIEPCVLRRSVDVPEGKQTRLVLAVAPAASGVWTLVVNANGERLHEGRIGDGVNAPAWQTVTLDLSRYAGKKLQLELLHGAVTGKPDAAYWGQVEIISQ